MNTGGMQEPRGPALARARSGPSRFSRLARLLAVFAPLAVSRCGMDAPTSPGNPEVQQAVGNAPEPTVRATVPSAAPRDTSIAVQIVGSGFDHGSRAVWALDGDTALATTRIRVDATTFVSSRELIADVTIAADAALDAYDVQVLATNGKKGIGIEIFEVTTNITTLPSLFGLGDNATAINDAGVVVGASVTDDRVYAVRWQRRGRIWTVDRLPAASTEGPNGVFFAVAYDIANDGTITGIRFHPGENQDPHAIVWPASGGVVDLGPGSATSVSSQGTVVGSRFDFDNSGPFNNQAVVWTRTSGHTWDKGQLLPRLQGGHGTVAYGINPGGNVAVGIAADETDAQYAVQWRLVGGRWQTPIPLAGGAGGVQANLANASGDVVGLGFPCDVPFGCSAQVLFWPSSGGRLDPASFGVFQTVNGGLSDAGEVVGTATTEDFREFAFFWRPRSGTLVDLGALLGDEGSGARDINNHRQVVGASFGPRGTRAVLWTAR
jgi:probable HAF family extracellular repeat protein